MLIDNLMEQSGAILTQGIVSFLVIISKGAFLT